MLCQLGVIVRVFRLCVRACGVHCAHAHVMSVRRCRCMREHGLTLRCGLYCARARAVFRGADAFIAYRLGWRAIRLAARLIARGVRAAFRAIGRAARWLGRGYDALLAGSTRACKSMGMVGEVLLIPVTVAWFGWPLASPWLFGLSRSLMVPAAGVSLALMVRSRGVINRAWR